MKQFLIFLKGFAGILMLMALVITCIGAFVSGDTIFVIAGIVSLMVIIWRIIVYVRKEKTKK